LIEPTITYIHLIILKATHQVVEPLTFKSIGFKKWEDQKKGRINI